MMKIEKNLNHVSIWYRLKLFWLLLKSCPLVLKSMEKESGKRVSLGRTIMLLVKGIFLNGSLVNKWMMRQGNPTSITQPQDSYFSFPMKSIASESMTGPYITKLKEKHRPLLPNQIPIGTFVVCPNGFGTIQDIIFDEREDLNTYKIELVDSGIILIHESAVMLASRA
jgi:hypothetical protein